MPESITREYECDSVETVPSSQKHGGQSAVSLVRGYGGCVIVAMAWEFKFADEGGLTFAKGKRYSLTIEELE